MTITHARYQEALADLYQRTTQGIKLGLENTHQLLRALGNPHHQMRHVVVAGTNGKGSTSSLLSQVLVEAGIETGLYTSPHLLRFTERIRVNGEEISRDKVLEYYQRIRAVEDQCDALPTFFEIATAMALLCFAEAKVEIAVMEVGLGGRLDSTNVVKEFTSSPRLRWTMFISSEITWHKSPARKLESFLEMPPLSQRRSLLRPCKFSRKRQTAIKPRYTRYPIPITTVQRFDCTATVRATTSTFAAQIIKRQI